MDNRELIKVLSVEESKMKLLSIYKVSKKLSIGYDSTKKLIENGIIKSVNVNGKSRVPEFRLYEFIESENPNVNKTSSEPIYEEDEQTAQDIINNLK